jgi:plasmid stabilization system protein ParE
MESGYQYKAQDAPAIAQQWAIGLMKAITSLETFPARCALAPENRYFPQEIRHLLYGKGRSIYRILFTINDDTVFILHIRHGAQDTLKPNRRRTRES